MKLEYLFLGVVLVGLAWWTTKPLEIPFLPWLPLRISLGFLSFPLLLGGATSTLYGILTRQEKEKP